MLGLITDHTSIPNAGPFRMLEAVSKSFVLDVGAHRKHITLDRLEPQHLVGLFYWLSFPICPPPKVCQVVSWFGVCCGLLWDFGWGVMFQIRGVVAAFSKGLILAPLKQIISRGHILVAWGIFQVHLFFLCGTWCWQVKILFFTCQPANSIYRL